MVTWTQIGVQAKPCGVLNVAGYYDPLLAWLNHAIQEGLIREGHRDLLLAGENAKTLLEQLAVLTLSEMPQLA